VEKSSAGKNADEGSHTHNNRPKGHNRRKAEVHMKKAQKGTEQSNNKLQCTNVAVYPFKESAGKTKGYARIELNGQLVLTGLRIVNGVNGYFVSYPIDPRSKEEDYHSIYYPLCKELREHIEQAILAKYAEIAGEAIQAEGV